MVGRPTSINAAMFLLVLASILSIVPLPLPGMDQVPQEIVYLGWVLGILGFVAAYGLFKLKSWGLWLGVAVAAIDGLAALPGVFAAPNTELKALAGTGFVVRLITVVLLLLKSSRSAVK